MGECTCDPKYDPRCPVHSVGLAEAPDTPEPGGPDLVAVMGQLAMAVREQARVMHSYYAALVESGFTPDQALALTLAYQTKFMSIGRE